MKILLGISGSISAYKTIDLARGLVKEGHEVKIILTEGALKFVVPEVFTYLGASDVYLSTDDFKHKNVLHVDLTRWCDVFVIAPTTANTLSKLASGAAHDLLTSVFLALPQNKNILIFPAMNTNMLWHPFTQENIEAIKRLKNLNNTFISPTDSGLLACQVIGEGKLPSVDELIELIPLMSHSFKHSAGKITITTGATIVPLDPVRYLTNSSSGITGYHLAKAALTQGHKVTVIAGHYATTKLDLLIKHPNFTLLRVKTVDDMLASVLKEIESTNIYISSAAISDIKFETAAAKMKKESMSDSLKITKAPDILKTIIGLKQKNLKIVGFAAETDLSDDVLNAKMTNKPVDLLVGTLVDNGLISHNQMKGFNVDSAYYRIFNKNGEIQKGELTKIQLASTILKLIRE